MKKLITILIILQTLFCKLSFSQNAGDLDSTFGVNGIVVTEINDYEKHIERGLFDGIKSIILQSDGTILCVGTADNGKHFIAVRYNNDGELDASYGEEGIVIIENVGRVVDAKQAANGKLVIAGYDSSFVLIRLNENGSIDSTFGVDGIVRTELPEEYSFKRLNGIEILSNDKILIVGSYIPSLEILSFKNLVAIRYLENGALDETFGEGGLFYYPTIFFSVMQNNLHIPINVINDNNYFVSFANSTYKFKNDGNIDSTFGINGKINFIYSVPSPPVSGCYLASNFISENEIVLLGMISGMYFQPDIKLSKLNISEGVDSAFGINGTQVITYIDEHANFHSSIVVQSDNKIITAGYRHFPDSLLSKFCFEIIRFHEDGTIDSTFGENGIVRTHISDSSQAFCSALQEDGKLLVAGVSDSGAFMIARYHTQSAPTAILPIENVTNNLLLYPNPVSDVLFIDKIHEPILQIEIRNILGREMHLPVNDKSINVSSLPSGIYFIKILTEKGETFGKFVKE